MANRYHVRSVSLPSRSHPTTLRVQEELNKLKTWEASSTSTSGSIFIGLSGLEDLYKEVNDLFSMSSAQDAFSHCQNGKCLDNLSDGSFKEQVQALQSALRRRKEDSSIEKSVANYTCFRNKINKGAKKYIAVLKQMESKVKASALEDNHLIRLFEEVIAMNISIFRSLFLFLSTSKPKRSRWSTVSKWMHKGTIACEEKQEIENHLESVDAALSERPHLVNIQIARQRLEALEASVEHIENCLENVFRNLIKTRAFILNIISQ
ncbi:hypothetical protein MANES_02G111900v8 [Manihot esculenta]|uniref:Uncharacterized protein n=1 Tax=Manihot esculenta TaxID=3983 RepID=A0A2C9WCU8_MANES|nr:hypothetical protein MANES_02G111900v8 [Manihot esculenta]